MCGWEGPLFSRIAFSTIFLTFYGTSRRKEEGSHGEDNKRSREICRHLSPLNVPCTLHFLFPPEAPGPSLGISCEVRTLLLDAQSLLRIVTSCNCQEGLWSGCKSCFIFRRSIVLFLWKANVILYRFLYQWMRTGGWKGHREAQFGRSSQFYCLSFTR